MIKKWLILGLAWLLVACGMRDEVAAAHLANAHAMTESLLSSE